MNNDNTTIQYTIDKVTEAKEVNLQEILKPNFQLDSEGRRIIYLTPSILKNINCKRFFHLSSLVGLQKKGSNLGNYKAAYGNAFGMFCDDYHCGIDFELARKRATDYYTKFDAEITDEKEWRTLTHLHRTIFKYKNEVPRSFFKPITIQDSNGASTDAVQVTVDIPFKVFNKYAFHLAGTIDKLATYSQYPVCVVDDKTTGAYNTKEFFNQFNLNLQVMSYVYLATKFLDKEESKNWLPFVVNGIFLKACTKKAEEAKQFDGAKFERYGPVFVPNELMTSYLNFLNIICLELNEYLSNKEVGGREDILFDFPNYTCCSGSFGKGCIYTSLCKFGSKEQMLPTIPSNFTNGNLSPTVSSITGIESSSED